MLIYLFRFLLYFRGVEEFWDKLPHMNAFSLLFIQLLDCPIDISGFVNADNVLTAAAYKSRINQIFAL
jgi:hypothetical protein